MNQHTSAQRIDLASLVTPRTDTGKNTDHPKRPPNNAPKKGLKRNFRKASEKRPDSCPSFVLRPYFDSVKQFAPAILAHPLPQ
jgi:hypothetical protein